MIELSNFQLFLLIGTLNIVYELFFNAGDQGLVFGNG